MTGASSNGTVVTHTTYKFNAQLSQVARFEFQTRPYEWIEFKNVSLVPGQKTDVEISTASQMSGKAEKQTVLKSNEPATQLAESVPVLMSKLAQAKQRYAALCTKQH